MNNPPRPSRQNHYVPEWYQKRFCPIGTFNFFLDLCSTHRRPDGSPVCVAPRRRSPKSSFWEQDLYVTRFGKYINDQIETVLFKGIDDSGANAIRAVVGGDPVQMHQHLEAFFSYLGAQKLRTPKGLDWIRSRYPALSQVELMVELQHLIYINCTLWAEAVREVVSAEDSNVKFLVTDHPVTTFNVAWPWESASRAVLNDAPVVLNGTQTIFALGANHCLILTHLPYAEAPCEVSLTARRENTRHFAPTLIRTDALIRSRRLRSDEVIVINHLLKARARRYIAAAESDWLYPERLTVTPGRIADVLLPPKKGLWHFGGETYIGYKDGRVDYRDAFGRTSKAHERLLKPPPQTPPDDTDACPCGSGATFQTCCKSLPLWERPPWNVRSLRERNLAFIRAVYDILGLGADRSWDDVRRELSDEQVARIHSVVPTLWPEDTDLAALLPRPNVSIVRAVYMGPSDPRMVGLSVVSLAPLFDQLLVMNPFLNPANIKPEYSPVSNPSKHKQQTLKNVLFLLTLEPLIRAGKVLLFPDPGDVVPEFQRAMWAMAEERTAQWRQQDPDIDDLRWLGRDEVQRSLYQLPDDALRSIAKQASPELSSVELNAFVTGVREKQQRDPFALLQPLPAEGQFAVVRSLNLETALYTAQLTGAIIVTDIKALWEHLHQHTRASDSGAANNLSARGDALVFRAHVHPFDAVAVSKTPEAASARAALLDIHAGAARREFRNHAGELINALRHRMQLVPILTGAAATSPEATDDIAFEISVPERGFESATAQRLIVSFGRDSAPVSVALALFRSSPTSASGENMGTHVQQP
jgi:hypothetical protein